MTGGSDKPQVRTALLQQPPLLEAARALAASNDDLARVELHTAGVGGEEDVGAAVQERRRGRFEQRPLRQDAHVTGIARRGHEDELGLCLQRRGYG